MHTKCSCGSSPCLTSRSDRRVFLPLPLTCWKTADPQLKKIYDQALVPRADSNSVSVSIASLFSLALDLRGGIGLSKSASEVTVSTCLFLRITLRDLRIEITSESEPESVNLVNGSLSSTVIPEAKNLLVLGRTPARAAATIDVFPDLEFGVTCPGRATTLARLGARWGNNGDVSWGSTFDHTRISNQSWILIDIEMRTWRYLLCLDLVKSAHHSMTPGTGESYLTWERGMDIYQFYTRSGERHLSGHCVQ